MQRLLNSFLGSFLPISRCFIPGSARTEPFRKRAKLIFSTHQTERMIAVSFIQRFGRIQERKEIPIGAHDLEIVLYGSYKQDIQTPSSIEFDPPLIRLENLKQRLVRFGYSNAKIVEDCQTPFHNDGTEFRLHEKVEWYMRSAEANIFVIFFGGDSFGIGYEIDYLFKHPTIWDRSFIAIEIVDQRDEDRLMGSVLRSLPAWEGEKIRKGNFSPGDDNELFEIVEHFLLNFLSRKYQRH